MRDACYRLTARFYFYDAKLCAWSWSSPRGESGLPAAPSCQAVARKIAMGARGEQKVKEKKNEHGTVDIMR